MRWKLLFVAPLLAAAVSIGAVVLWLSTVKYSSSDAPPDFVFLLGPPVITAAISGFFVYRHTPRRRVLQAVIASLLSLAIFFCLFYFGFQAVTDYLSR